jgi:hypothetical protein
MCNTTIQHLKQLINSVEELIERVVAFSAQIRENREVRSCINGAKGIDVYHASRTFLAFTVNKVR